MNIGQAHVASRFRELSTAFSFVARSNKRVLERAPCFCYARRAEKNSKLSYLQATYGKEPIWAHRTGDRFGERLRKLEARNALAGVSPGDPALVESDRKADWRIYPGRSGARALVVDFGHASRLGCQRWLDCRFLPDTRRQGFCEFQDQSGAGTRAGRLLRRAAGSRWTAFQFTV